MDTLEKQFQEAVDLDDIPGAVVTGRDATGSFNYARSFGHRTLLNGDKKSLSVNDVLAIYSATKLITAVATLQCVEKGLFKLDEDISRILPHFKTVQVITGFDGDKPQFEEKKKAVTLRQLLTHSAGTPYDMLDPLLGKWREQNGGAAASWSPTLEGRYTTPLAFQPGERFGYGPGLDWAGRAVELVSHKTLGEYFQDHIFAPLGVKNASFFPNKDPALKALMVDLNPEDPHGIGLAPMGGIPSQGTVAECFGGQGLYMPAAEYIKVLYSLLASDGKLLSPKTVDMMFEPSLESAAHTFVNTTFAEEMANSPMGAGMPKETQRDYALGGLLVQTAQPGSFAEGTMVWGGAFNSAWFIDRKTGLCGFGAPQPYLRDGPATRGEGYVFKPHREGAMRWEKSVEHFKIVYRKGIYQVYQEWKERK